LSGVALHISKSGATLKQLTPFLRRSPNNFLHP
jgi:hypothetical protein